MMKRKTWLTIGIAALLLFCTAVLAEGANRNVPLDSALDAALNAPGSGIAFANGSAYPWQVVEIDGRTAAKSGNAGAPNSSSAVSAQVTIAEGQSLSFDWNVDGEPTTGALAMWDYLVFIVDGEYIDYIHSVEENTPLGWETFTWTPDEAGTYTVEWTYNKDASNNSGADCGYLDNVAVIGEPVQTAAPTAEPQPGEEFTIFEENFHSFRVTNGGTTTWTVTAAIGIGTRPAVTMRPAHFIRFHTALPVRSRPITGSAYRISIFPPMRKTFSSASGSAHSMRIFMRNISTSA